ncbi:MAG: hypothetical protein WBV93_08770 [Anaerobacillus sp.]
MGLFEKVLYISLGLTIFGFVLSFGVTGATDEEGNPTSGTMFWFYVGVLGLIGLVICVLIGWLL